MKYAIAGLVALLVLAFVWRGGMNGGSAGQRQVNIKTPGAQGHAGADSAGLHGSNTSPAAAAAEQGHVARAKGWMTDKTPEGRDGWQRIGATVQQLSLESVRGLLADPSLLEDIEGPEQENGFPNPVYPRREILARLLWERYGKLAPQEALDRAFASGDWTKDYWRAGPLLTGVAKTDPQLALNFLNQPPAGLDLQAEGLSRGLEDLMPLLAKHSPDAAFTTIPKLPAMVQGEAYNSYLNALGAGTDWQKEVTRLQQELPQLADIRAANLAGAWARTDPDAAFAWIATDGGDKGSAYSTAIWSWMYREPVEAAAWLKDWQAEGVDRNAMYTSMLVHGGASNPGVSDGLLQLIEDPSARTGAVLKTMDYLGKSMDPEVLRHLQGSPLLSDEARTAVATTLAERDAKAGAR